MQSELIDIENSILDCKKSIEEFDNAIQNIHWQTFERIQNAFGGFADELSNLTGLLDDIDVADDKTGAFTTDALTKIGLLAQQLELAEYQVDQYDDAIKQLQKDYNDGKVTTVEYSEKLSDLIQNQWNAVNSAESMRDAILEVNKSRVNEVVSGIQKEIDQYRELTNEVKENLNKQKDLHDHQKSLADKTKAITKLEREIATMTSTDAATTAKRLQKEAELAKAKEDLAEYEYSHSITQQQNALDEQLENFEKERNAEIDVLNESLNDQEKLISDSLNSVKRNTETIANQIDQIANNHGIYISETLTSSWRQGENAIAGYGQTLSVQSSAFIANLNSVENNAWKLQNQANSTASSLVSMFSTRADSLVNELNNSYNSAYNLDIMTQTLRNSLVNTLNGSYDAGGIINSINGIANAANNAADAVRAMKQEQAAYEQQQAKERYRVIDTNRGNMVLESNLSYETAMKIKRDSAIPENIVVQKYASGTRHTRGNIIVKNEEGYELALPRLSNGNYAITPEGSQILTKLQTDNIFDWSKFNPSSFMDDIMPRFKPVIPKYTGISGNNTLNLDEFIHIDKVDGTNIKQVESIAKKAVDRLVGKMYDGIKYGSY